MNVTTRKCHGCDEVLVSVQMSLLEAEQIYLAVPGDDAGKVVADFNRKLVTALKDRGVKV